MTPRPLLAVLAALLGASLAAGAPARAQDSTATDGLGPTTAPPWNPPRPEPAMRPWEMVLRAPGRIATLPLSALGHLAKNGLLAMEENSVVPKTLMVLAAPARYGVYVMPATLGDRTGLGGRVLLQPDFVRRLVFASVSGSTGGYSRIEAGFGPPIARFEFEQDWRPHDRLYGVGMGAREDGASSYSNAVRSFQLRTQFGFGRAPELRPARHTLTLAVTSREMTLGEPQGEPDDDVRFDRAAPPLAEVLNEEWNGQILSAAFQSDLRRGRPHWAHGFRVRAGVDHFDPDIVVPDIGLGPSYYGNFQRYTLELEGGLSFHRDPRTFRLLARAVDTEITDAESGATVVPVSDLPSLGGGNGLAGYEPGRFRDLDALLTRLSYLFPLAQHYELDLHVEAGGVYPDLQHHARLKELKTSFGIAFRPRTHVAPLAEIGADWSREGARIHFQFGGVE